MELIKEILVDSFQENKSVLDLVKQDAKKKERLALLIDYSIFMGENFGKIYLNNSKNACAIIINSEKKKITLTSIWWNIKLIFSVIGLSNVIGVLKRTSLIAKFYPSHPYVYLWYIGVKTNQQGKGFGSELLKEIIAENKNKSIYLESSSLRNFPFYEKYGFKKITNFRRLVGYDLHLYRYQKTENF